MKTLKGFARLSAEQRIAVASRGGKAAHVLGTAHEWTPGESREAGVRGGDTVSRDRAHMAEIGRRGGIVSAARRAANRAMERSMADLRASGGIVGAP